MDVHVFDSISDPGSRRGRGRGGGRGRGRGSGRGSGRGRRQVDSHHDQSVEAGQPETGGEDEDARAYEDAMLIDDTVQEINLRSNTLPAVVIGGTLGLDDSLPEQPSLRVGSLTKLQGLFCRIRFDDEDHGAHIAVRFIFALEPISKVATIRMNTLTLQESKMKLEPLAVSERRRFIDDKDIADTSELVYKFTINGYDPTHLSAQNLFVETDETDIFKDARALFDINNQEGTKQLAFVIRATASVEHNYSNFLQMFQSECELHKIGQTALSRWYPKHPDKIFIQKGDYPPANDRPQYSYPEAKHSFFDLQEYLTVHGFGVIAEAEYIKSFTEDSYDLRLKLVAIPGYGDREYLGLLGIPLGSTCRLNPGDRLTINFDPKIDSSDYDWSATVLEALPFASAREVTISLFPPWDKSERKYRFPKTELRVVQLKDVSTTEEAFDLMAKAHCHPVIMRILDSEKHFKRQLNTLRNLPTRVKERKEIRDVLLANFPSSMTKRDMFAHRRATQPNIEHHIGLSDSQVRRAETYRTVAGPVAMLQGPPGTGKTFVACRIALTFLEATPPLKVMIASPMNNSVDATTIHLQQLLSSCSLKKIMVIRLHTGSTEEDVSLKGARDTRGRPEDARPIGLDEAELDMALTEARYASRMYEFYKANTVDKRPHGVADRRLNLIDLSLGTWMLRVAGIVDPDGPFNHRADFPDFNQSYIQFSKNLMAEGEDMINFRAQAKQLRERTLAMANVVACTLSQCADAGVYDYFQPEFTIIEEAARALEVDCIMPLVFYSPKTTLLVGDHKQLTPTVFSSVQDNVFALQLQNSLFSRLRNAGYVCPVLNENRRMQSETAELIAKLFYRSEQLAFTTPEIPYPDVAERVKEFNHVKYGKTASSYLWLDVPLGRAQKEPTRESRYNPQNAAVAITLVQQLLEQKVVQTGDDIVILTPYHAQFLLLSTAVTLLRLGQPELPVGGLTVAKVDAFQGNERQIIIVDFVVDQMLGFVRIMNRINVAVSRSQCGLYMIGNSAEMEKNHRQKVKWLRKLINHCKESYRFWKIRDLPSSDYIRSALEQIIEKPSMEAESGVDNSSWDNQAGTEGWGDEVAQGNNGWGGGSHGTVLSSIPEAKDEQMEDDQAKMGDGQEANNGGEGPESCFLPLTG